MENRLVFSRGHRWGLGEGAECRYVAIKKRQDFSIDGNVLYLDCITVNFPVAT